MAAIHQTLELELPEGFTLEEREAIAQEAIDFIAERTREGLDKNGRPWSGRKGRYSEEYEASLDFRIAGKTPGQEVDLTASGELLDGIELLENESRKVTIGYEEGSDLNAKADGNIRGTYGKQAPNKKVARPFLDISKEDLDAIIQKFEPQRARRLRTEIARRSVLFESVIFEDIGDL